MKITRCDVVDYQLDFRTSFKIAYEDVKEARVFFVRLITDSGLIGYGSGAPDEEVTGEKFEDVLRAAKEVMGDFFVREAIDINFYNKLLHDSYPFFSSLRAAIELALLDILSQAKGVPMCQMFGDFRQKFCTLITVDIRNQEETVLKTLEALARGFKIIKLKCGIDVKDDLSRILAVKKILPRGAKLVLDANQGYNLNDAKFLLNSLRGCGVAFFEQPVVAADEVGLKELTDLKIAPIIADEAVVDKEDAERILKNGAADGINIKIMKCGGLLDFVEIFSLAKKMGKMVNIGCMYESHLTMAAGAHLALALPIDYVDLDSGLLDFDNDPFYGGVIFNGEEFYLDKHVRGLGVHPRLDTLFA